MEKISVVIPIYNAASSIIAVLDSVLNQTVKVFEVIIINDCSIDNSFSILNNYISEKSFYNFKLINLTENKGVSYCRNLGWNTANGDFVAFLDSDDYWNQNKLQIMINIIKSNNIDMIGHAYCEKHILVDNYTFFNKRHLKKVSFFSIMVRNKFQTSCVLIRKELDERFNEKISHCEDYELFVRLIANNYNVFYYKDQLTYLGRPQLSKGGLSEKKIQMRLGEIKAFKIGLKLKKISFLLPLFVVYSFIKYFFKILR